MATKAFNAAAYKPSHDVWWLHIRSDIDSFIKQCSECQISSVLPREPLITATLLFHPLHQTYFT